MSEDKKTSVVASVNEGMTVHRGTVSASTRLYAKTWTAALVSLLVVVLVAGGIVAIIRMHDDKNVKPKTVQVNTDGGSTPYSEATGQSLHGHPAALDSILQSQLKTSTTNAQKINLYGQMMAAAFNANQNAQVITYGMQAEAIMPDSQTEDMIASAYQLEGNNTEAKVWVQKAIANLNKNSPGYTVELTAFNQQLEGL